MHTAVDDSPNFLRDRLFQLRHLENDQKVLGLLDQTLLSAIAEMVPALRALLTHLLLSPAKQRFAVGGVLSFLASPCRGANPTPS